MTDVYSVHYDSKSSKEFTIPFKISNNLEVKVWVNNILQLENKDYYVYLFDSENIESNVNNNNDFGKVVFFQEVGDLTNSKIVTIEKNSLIERKSDFKNFTNFNANVLNLELNNFLDIFKCLKVGQDNGVQKSKSDVSTLNVIMPDYSKGKGLYWGEEGQIVNTDKNINDVLNNLASYNPSNQFTTIEATNVFVDTANTSLKQNNAQIFLENVDLKIINLEKNAGTLASNIGNNTSNISSITETINNTVLQKFIGIEESINNLEKNTQNLTNNNIKTYSIVSYPLDNNKKPNYLQFSSSYKLALVNISKESPLILNFANKDSSILYTADSIDNFTSEYCNMPHTKSGRYYIRASLDSSRNKLDLAAYKKRPYFGLNVPSSNTLQLHGCSDTSDYFVIKDRQFYCGSNGKLKNKTASYIYLGYLDIDDDGNAISNINYFTENDSFEYFIDVSVKQKYVIDNLLGCNSICINIYALCENNLIPICNQTKTYNHNGDNIEVGVSCIYNMDEIVIYTADNGIWGYSAENKVIYKETGTLKVIVTRDF